MENKQLSNFKYTVFESTHEGVREVVVTFNYGDRSVRRIIFCHNKNNAACINEAKKIIKNELETGKLIKYTKRYLRSPRRVNAGLKIALVVSCAVAAGLAGFCTYLYLNPQGGDTPSGETVKVGLSTEAKEAIEIDKSEAVIGKEFNAKITVKEENMQIISMLIKSGDNELKVTDDYKYEPITSNDKLTYSLKIYAKAVVGIVQILKVDLAPIGEDWADITKEKAIELANSFLDNIEDHEKNLTKLLRSEKSQGVYQTIVKVSTGNATMIDTIQNLYFNLRNISPDPVDKDIYIKREQIDNLTEVHNENYYVFLPNSKKTTIDETGIYNFMSAPGKLPTSNVHRTCAENEIEAKIGEGPNFVFDYFLGYMLEAANGDIGLLNSIAILSDPSCNPSIDECYFKSKDDKSLLGSITGSYTTEVEGKPSRVSFNVKNMKIKNYIFTDADGSIELSLDNVTMHMDITSKLTYKEIENEYDPIWPIS